MDDNKIVEILPKDVIHHELKDCLHIDKMKRYDIIYSK